MTTFKQKAEIWKDIPSREWMYQVSNLGNVRSIRYAKNGRIFNLKPQKTNCGYLATRIGFDRKKYLIHRLVAMAFLKAKEGEIEVNHINGIKTDNRVENLEWCTISHNKRHSLYQLGNISKIVPRKSEVVQMDLEGNEIQSFGTVKEAAEKLGLSSSNIVRCCRAKAKTTGGFTWKYL